MSYGGPPPQPGYGAPPPAYGQPANVVHVAAPMRFGETPVPMNCPFCGVRIVTGTEYKVGLMTWLACGAVCLFGSFFGGITWLGCCLIPCCINACKDVVHTCPNCHRELGKYNRL